MTLPTPNPAGRRKLTFAFRPLRAWTEQRLAIVRELLVTYFKRIGGFALVNSATIRAWCDILDVFSAAELLAAIEAKTLSLAGGTAGERRDRRKFAVHPARFIRSAGYWLSQSPENRARQQAGRDLRAERLRRALSEIKARAGLPGLAAEQADQTYGDAAPRVAESPDGVLWPRLSPARRLAAMAAVGPIFRARCRQWGVSPEDSKLACVLSSTACEWASRQWPATDLFGGVPTFDRR